MTVSLSPFAGAGWQYFDNNGVPLAGGLLYTYAAGTSTPAVTYTSFAGNVANSNPIVLDSSGRVPNEVWLTTGVGYKFVLQNSNATQIGSWDNIPNNAVAPYANDSQYISYEQGNSTTAGNFIVGQRYLITSVGTTNFVAIGASANTTGIYFTATGVGSGTGTAQISLTVQAKLQQYVTPLDFGAFGDGSHDDTQAMMNAFASGLPVDGLGKTYVVNNSSLNTVIDTTATGSIGYGAGTKWFLVSQSCRNMTLQGNVSFGGGGSFFLPKGSNIDNVTVTGLARFSSWFTTYNNLVLSGNSYFGGDYPPSANFYGFFYNTFISCSFQYAIVDERYGPVNLNTWQECRFVNFNIIYSGNTGWTVSDIQSFHMNTFIGCEVNTQSGQGITAPDGHQYSVVMNTGTTSNGTNTFFNLYNESPVNGIYGDCFVVDTIHTSGNSVTFGSSNTLQSGSLGYNNPLSGEGGNLSESRTTPFIYPAKDVAYGDWSILNSQGVPISLTSTNCTVSVFTDTNEPTGLGRTAKFTSTANFATVSLVSSPYINENNKTLTSFCVIYTVYSGTPGIQTINYDGSTIYGAASYVNLTGGFIMATGTTYGLVTFQSSTAYSIGISSFTMARGSGVLSPATNLTNGNPIIDLSGGDSLVSSQLLNSPNSTYYNTKVLSVASNSTTSWYSINFGNFSGQIADVKVIAGFISSTAGSRVGIRESLIKENGSGGLVETNITSNVGSSMSITFSLSGTVLTVQTTTSAGVAETARIAIQVMGPGMNSSIISILV